MTMDETTKPVMPRTLGEAHEALALAYYRRAAALFTEIAEIDRGHHHESLYWADHECERAKEIKYQIHTLDDQ
jgi:hypothetical protein